MLFDTKPTTDPECDPTASLFAGRWDVLRRSVDLSPTDDLCVALSGGADSVLLLHLAANARPRPKLLAVHVDHGLRGAESDGDAEFCVRLCERLSVPFVRRRVELDPAGPSLEAQAREVRYRALEEEARRAGIRKILTGHHSDDALETLLFRWLRGTEMTGLCGLRERNALTHEFADAPLDRVSRMDRANAIEVLRPLIGMRREEVRHLLTDHGLEWREDSSNQSQRFTRNKIRGDLLPRIEAACGPRGVESLRAFGRAVETLEEHLASRTAHLTWSAPVCPTPIARPGGTIARGVLMALPRPLRRRALWRLLGEGTGKSPSRAILDLLLSDLEIGRCTRRSVGLGFELQLRSDKLHLTPPRKKSELVPPDARLSEVVQHALPSFGPLAPTTHPGLRLPTAGTIALPDGRTLRADLVRPTPGSPVPRHSAECVELDAAHLEDPLTVRWPRPGDRFHPLGAPGRRRLVRFLADAGVPRADRANVPLVFSGGELIWVCGIRPCEGRRVRRSTTVRLRLELR